MSKSALLTGRAGDMFAGELFPLENVIAGAHRLSHYLEDTHRIFSQLLSHYMEDTHGRRDADYSAGLLMEARSEPVEIRAHRSGVVSMVHFPAVARKGTTLYVISQEVRM
jgi:hypothetical protein